MQPFNTGHEDIVHDVAYDFYGRTMATCSSDQHIKVFKLDKDATRWELNDSWRAHDSSIVSLDWASPEYGRIIASASYDKTIKIWEEDPNQEECSGRRWTRLCTLNDSKGSLYCVKFAPSHLGLRIASIGNDGIMRMYDALDPSNLRSWTMTAEVKVLPVAPANNLQSAFGLSWCFTRFSPEKIAVCALDQAYIYQRGKDGHFYQAGKLPGHTSLIRSISWAPLIGRPYHLIATGCKDGRVRIFRVNDSPSKSNTPNLSDSDDYNMEDQGIKQRQNNTDLEVELLSEHDDHKGEVWSVSWNLTGTILSSTGEDGKVRLWKSTYSNEYKCMSIITSKQDI
ncbi:Nucleoporin SEH1 [Nakaseomyces glabratus]|uniref:Nucleoporin SEH1 n=1 Tax=Candida glabrata TaxID=5478 RepID=A0A0W0CF39_CANGB|nr:Trp-Asp (WD) repeats profile [Nakaseomyces glabratus]KAH7584256.1 Trp-Asp (WD) repeats profile [Nakaseomyces glabratus]KAH7585499.1 Trp-Asp (WD) repeats profile [Nakaseomyces glabratus]KAH7598000.1 Trp-Asp (WD) repeats profile [Nakaseomyces glabratus]KAH7612294.1 Trp-Asp (WD) repeats profile [Nakaseomyces glabratus]